MKVYVRLSNPDSKCSSFTSMGQLNQQNLRLLPVHVYGKNLFLSLLKEKKNKGTKNTSFCIFPLLQGTWGQRAHTLVLHKVPGVLMSEVPLITNQFPIATNKDFCILHMGEFSSLRFKNLDITLKPVFGFPKFNLEESVITYWFYISYVNH